MVHLEHHDGICMARRYHLCSSCAPPRAVPPPAGLEAAMASRRYRATSPVGTTSSSPLLRSIDFTYITVTRLNYKVQLRSPNYIGMISKASYICIDMHLRCIARG